jgi:hypothetical protein
MQSLLFTCLLALVLPHAYTIQYNQPEDSCFQHEDVHHNQRTVDHCTYEILDTSYFILYHRLNAVEKIPNKGVMMVDHYYFSRTASDEIYELSIDNLKKAFPLNHRFHYALDEYFRSDRELMEYDGYLKEYKLKYIFVQSIKE